MIFHMTSRYGMKSKLIGYAHRLAKADHHVVSRWLYATTPLAPAISAKRTIEDIDSADMVIAFTEDATPCVHTEIGLAIAAGKIVWVIGPYSSVFSQLETVRQYECFESVLALLTNHVARLPLS